MPNRKLEDFTELDFLEYVTHLLVIGYKTEREDNEAVHSFVQLAEHPSGTDLLFYPEPSRPDTPEAIVSEVKVWRAANGKPGFKPQSR